MSDTGKELMFVCNYGLGRSRAAEKAFSSLGVNASCFVGGTREMGSMSDEEIKEKIPADALVFLIYDQRSRREEYEDKQKAIERFKKLNIDYEVIDSAKLAIMLYDRGIDIDDFL